MMNVENTLKFQQTLQLSSLGLMSLGWEIGSTCTYLTVDFQSNPPKILALKMSAAELKIYCGLFAKA
jgi:hypothetical protein